MHPTPSSTQLQWLQFQFTTESPLALFYLFQDFHWPVHVRSQLMWCISSKVQDLEEPDPHTTTIFLEGHEGPETENDWSLKWRNPPFGENDIPT